MKISDLVTHMAEKKTAHGKLAMEAHLCKAGAPK